MAVKRTGADPKKDIERIVKAIADNADRVRIVTFNTVKGQMARRIWNNGQATGGERIGNYKPSTKKIRQELGFRIDTVDLEQSGTLRRSLVVGTADGKAVIGMLEQKEPVRKIQTGAKTKRVRGIGEIMNVGAVGRSKSTNLSSDTIAFHEFSEITTVQNAIIQENHFNKEIFAPSKEEIERGEKTVIKEINLIVQKALRQS